MRFLLLAFWQQAEPHQQQILCLTVRMIALVVLSQVDEIPDELSPLICFVDELSPEGVATELCCLVLESKFGVCLCQIELCQRIAIFDGTVADPSLIVVPKLLIGFWLQSVVIAVVMFQILICLIDLSCLAQK